jgi:hypothetical protein
MKAFSWSLGKKMLTDGLPGFRISWVCYLSITKEIKTILNAIRPFFLCFPIPPKKKREKSEQQNFAIIDHLKPRVGEMISNSK